MDIVFEVTFDADDLDVAAEIYDVSTGTPVLETTTAMTVVASGRFTYFGSFTADPDKKYVVVKSVFTDNTFATLDTNYMSGSDAVVHLAEES